MILESRGFAFVRFYDKRDAEDAIEGMDGKDLDGRELRVDIARHDRPQPCKYDSLTMTHSPPVPRTTLKSIFSSKKTSVKITKS